MKYFYEDIFRAIGEFGPWQLKKVMILWWCLFLIGVHFTTVDYLEFNTNEFFCDFPQCQSYDTSFFANKSSSLQQKIEIFNYTRIWPRLEKFRELKFDLFDIENLIQNAFCKIYHPDVDNKGYCKWNLRDDVNNRSLYRCSPGPGNHFHFNQNFQPKNIVSHFGLLCDKYKGKMVIKIIFVSGSLIGCVVGALLLSRGGRRLTFIISLLSIAIGSIISCIRNFYYAYLPGSFLSIAGCFGLYQVSFIYLVEIVGWRKQVFSRFRWFTYDSLIGMSFFIPYYLGKIVAAVVIEVILLEFNFYCILIAVVSSLSTFLVYFLPESPRWLLVNYKVEKANKILQSIAKENKKKVTFDIEVVKAKKVFDADGAKLKDYVKVKFVEKHEDVWMEIRSYKWKILVCSECAMYTLAFIFSGFLSHMNHEYIQDKRRHEENLTTYGLSLVGVVMVILLEGKLGRRVLLLLFQGFMSFSIIFCQIISQAHAAVVSVDQKDKVIHRLHSCQIVADAAGTSLLIWYALSVYPTTVRGVFFGITMAYQILIRVLSDTLLSGLIMIMNEEAMESDVDMVGYGPYIPLSFGYLIACISCNYLPEILHVPHPDTLEDVTMLQKRRTRYPNYNESYLKI